MIASSNNSAHSERDFHRRILGALTLRVIFVIVSSSNPGQSARDLRTGDHALFNTRVDKRSFSVFADRKNMHAALLRFLAYFLTIQLDENITR